VRGALPQTQRAGLDTLVELTRSALERECLGVAYGNGTMKKAFDGTVERWFEAVTSQPWWRLQ
jgi:hypothetical protein